MLIFFKKTIELLVISSRTKKVRIYIINVHIQSLRNGQRVVELLADSQTALMVRMVIILIYDTDLAT